MKEFFVLFFSKMFFSYISPTNVNWAIHNKKSKEYWKRGVIVIKSHTNWFISESPV